MNGTPIGRAPAEFRVDESTWRPPYRYRAELPGYLPAEGELTTIPATGRIVGAIFTLGIVAAARPMSKFRDSYTITLQPDPNAPPPARGDSGASSPLERRLAELKELFEGGKISADEYAREKQKALEGLR